MQNENCIYHQFEIMNAENYYFVLIERIDVKTFVNEDSIL